ncbi:YtxH domain-containing protein [Romboutsia sp. 1001713B170131_170501_G6]|uniref:YtxH domain-containing protein n=1 Tax=Romboutsia sp. 1001713B170131_170501_G6 TaxID=2787108 RepID=UPI0018AC2FDA|nr:YtxH domain-containing protein [Romboutsia sp. 1001713B170131_170501_G6]
MSNKKGKYLLLGAFLGFIAGLFFAPKKGSELRRDAKEKIDEVKENPKEALQGTIDGVKTKINNLIDDNISEDSIDICEDEIVISRTFEDEGENN